MPKKILIVDDSWLIRQGVSKLLKIKNYDSIEAKNGKEALEKIETEKPDCVLLDLLMPDCNGIEVLSAMKEKNLNIPVIIQSADIQETTRTKCFNLGAAAFLDKPVQKDRIMETIEKVLKEGQNGIQP